MLADGTITFPTAVVEVTLANGEGDSLAGATLTPLASGEFRVETRRREGSTSYGSSGEHFEPGFQLTVPAGQVNLRVRAAGYRDVDRVLDVVAPTPGAAPFLLLLRRNQD